MKTLKHILSLLILTWTVCALTACGGDDDPLLDPGYNIDLPQTAHDKAGQLKSTPFTEAEKAELERQGHKIVGTPVHITLGDEEHVFLQELATVSFDIPADIPQEEYDNLIGASIAEGRITYMALDPTQLRKGKAVFRTAHFSDELLMWKTDKEMLDILRPRIAAAGYQKSMRDAGLQKTAKERIAADLDRIGLGNDKLLGRVLRKVVEENEYTAEVVELVNSDDPAARVTERATEIAAEKALEKLFAAYQEKYKKNSAEAEESELAKTLQEHLTTGNVKEWGTKLGGGTSPAALAKQYAKELVVGGLKEYSTHLLPIINVMQAEAEAIEVLKDFWVDNTTEESFQAYRRLSPDRNGRISDEDWSSLASTYMAAIIRQYRIDGKMGEAEIRAMFEQRVRDSNALSTEEGKLRKQFEIWEEAMLLKRGHVRFGYDMDLSVRITILHNLTERFRKEFVYKGSIPKKGDWTLYTDDRLLGEMVYQYLNFFPDTQKFYDWARAQGFYGDRLQRDLEELSKDRAWYFVRVEIDKSESKTGDVYWEVYEASEGHHLSRCGTVADFSFPKQSAWFEATCTSPPKLLRANDVVVLHATIKTDSNSATDYYWRSTSGVNFDKEDCGMRCITIWAKIAKEENLKGSMWIGSRPEDAKRGECDYKLVMPSGSKGALWAINFNACGSRTHWVYQWRSPFE